MHINGNENTIEESENGITLTAQLAFFAPLAVSTLFMYITLSLFNAVLARLPSPETFIAANAIAQSFAFLLESCVIPIRQLMTAMVSDRQSYIKTVRFIKFLAVFVVLAFTIIIFSGLAEWILKNIMGVEGRILQEAVVMLKVIFIFPAVVAFRNFFQGLLMKFRMTPLITAGAVVRMLFVGAVFLLAGYMTRIPGSVVAGFLLLGAILVEGVSMLIGTRIASVSTIESLDSIRNSPDNSPGKEVTYRMLLAFIIPLILTSFIGTVTTSVVNMGLSRTTNPVIALSSFSVGWDLGMVFVSPLLMFHQIPLNCMRSRNSMDIKSVRKFMIIMGASLWLVLSLVAFTPAGHFLLRYYMGVSEEISARSADVLKVMSILPLIAVLREFNWGLLIKRYMTGYIVTGKTIGIIVLVFTVAAITMTHPENPALIGAWGMVISQGAELLYVFWIRRRKIPYCIP